MARPALSTKANPQVQAKRAEIRKTLEEKKISTQIEARRASVREKHGAQFKNKKFKDLSPAQKDKLLAAMAIELGFLDDD